MRERERERERERKRGRERREKEEERRRTNKCMCVYTYVYNLIKICTANVCIFRTEILKLWVNEKRVQTLEHEATKMVA